MDYGNITVILLTLENIAGRSKNRHVEDIIDRIRMIDKHLFDKIQLPVIFVASYMRSLPEARRKREDQTQKSSTGNSLERRLKILEYQIVTVLMETRRAQPVDRQSGNQHQPYSSVIRGDRQPDVKKKIIPGVRHPGPITRGVHWNQTIGITTVRRDGMSDNIQTVYSPTTNWQTVGKHRTRARPKPVFGKEKSDENPTALPRRYTVVVFNVSSKEDKIKN